MWAYKVFIKLNIDSINMYDNVSLGKHVEVCISRGKILSSILY